MKTIGLMSALILVLLVVQSATHALALSRSDQEELERNWHRFLQAPDSIPPNHDFPYAQCFRKASLEHQIPQALLLAVARGESNFDANAVSHADAYGLMQILWPTTAHHLGITRRSALFDPCTNIDAGARYLGELLKRYNNNLHRTLAAYNYGPSRIAVDGDTLPDGANWYSGYIYRHLAYVQSQAVAGDQNLPDGQGEILVIRFLRPYRAAALVEQLQPRLGDIRLDWFRRPRGGFDVVMRYKNQAQLDSGVQILRQEGLGIQSSHTPGVKI